MKNLKLVSSSRGKKVNNEAYVMAIVSKSQDTLEILVRRALMEASEESTMRIIETERRQAQKTATNLDLKVSKRISIAFTGKDKTMAELSQRRTLMRAASGGRGEFPDAPDYNKASFKVVNRQKLPDIEMQSALKSTRTETASNEFGIESTTQVSQPQVVTQKAEKSQLLGGFFDMSRIKLGKDGQVN
jgi:hypothetical protein